MQTTTEHANQSYLTEKALADEIQVKPQTLAVWRTQGRGPAFVKLGRSVRYRRVDVEQFINSQRRNFSAA